MGRKKAANGPSSLANDESASVVSESDGTKSSITAAEILAASANVEREPIKVNNANLSDLKNSCDDVVKRVSWFEMWPARAAALDAIAEPLL